MMDSTARLEKLREIALQCRQCDLYKTRRKLVFGDGTPDAWIMFIGEGPGADEDREGVPFVGRSGKLLRSMITAVGLTEKDRYIANIVKDRPPGNRDPQREEIKSCIKFLYKQIEIIGPEYLVLLGRTAVKGILPEYVGYSIESLRELSKTRNDLFFNNIPVLVTYHPSALLRNAKLKPKAAEDFRFIQALSVEHDEIVEESVL
jgi:DNA polymerase